MRPLLRLCATLILLAACQMQAPTSGPAAGVLVPEAIAVTSLDPPASPVGPDARSPTSDTAVKRPDQTTPRSADAAETAPTTLPEAALCQKSGGRWSAMTGSAAHVCVHEMRDSGKTCRKKTECQGECLARSNTCAPISPLMGCNDILQTDGTEVTLCLQ